MRGKLGASLTQLSVDGIAALYKYREYVVFQIVFKNYMYSYLASRGDRGVLQPP